MRPRATTLVATGVLLVATVPLGCVMPPVTTMNPLMRGAPAGAPYDDAASSWRFGQELERFGAAIQGEIHDTQAQISAQLDAERLGRTIGEVAGEVIADIVPGVPASVGTQVGGFLGSEMARSIMAVMLLLTTGGGGVLYGRHRGWDEYAEARRQGLAPEPRVGGESG